MDMMKSNVVVGIGAALAATIFAPILVPVVTNVGRPLIKSLLKGGMMLYEKSREATALAGEAVEDLIAEVRAEHADAMAKNAGPAAADDIDTMQSQAEEDRPAPARNASEPGPERHPIYHGTAADNGMLM